MKKLVYSLLAIAAATMAFSCVKSIDEAPVKDNEVVQPETRTFYCTFAEPATKFAVAADGKTKWEVGDEIMIHGGEDGTERYKVTLGAGDILEEGKKAKISFTINPYDRSDAGVVSKYYAQYPASLVPDGLIYYEARFTDSKDFIMAACDVDDTFVFFNLNGIISYKVSGDFDKVVFSGNNGEVVGYTGTYQARVRNEGSGAKLTNPKFGNGSGDAVTVNSVEMVPVADGTTTNYIFLPAGTNFTDGFTFKFYKGEDLKKVAVATTPVNVATGKFLALGDITSKLKDYVEVVDPTSDHDSAITGATDLSAKQANCYVITAPGAYKFPSLVGNTDEPTLHVHDAVVLWETYNNAEAVTANSVIEAVDFEDDWIYFKTPASLKAGNALIAAKDHSGKIIWSWHIWIPSSAIANVDATTEAGLTMMDRNLGALVVTDKVGGAAIESCGTYYQYGRKDPFIGPKAFESSSQATIAEGQTGNTLNGGAMNLNESIANPTVFGDVSGGDWQTGTTSKWSATTKTAYDPCPSGYRIAYGEKGSSAAHYLWNDTNIKTAAGDAFEESSEGHWFRVGSLVFPLGGYFDDNQESADLSICHVYDRAGIWFMPTNTSSKYHLNIRISSTYKAGSTYGARGCSIRCCVDE